MKPIEKPGILEALRFAITVLRGEDKRVHLRSRRCLLVASRLRDEWLRIHTYQAIQKSKEFRNVKS